MFQTEKKYKVILADPPWSYKAWSKKGEGRSAESHYNTMSVDDICAMPVQTLADDDCALFMWGTWPTLQDAMRVMEAWGFKYKTCGFLWMKQRKNAPPMFAEQRDVFTGMGYWTRSNTEFCLLGTIGNPKRLSKAVKQAILAPIREHSRKPDCVHQRIEQLLDGAYIELFARQKRDGWDCWGNETDKFS